MKKVTLLMLTLFFAFIISACARVREIQKIEFENFPKTLYVVGETLAPFSVKVTPSIDGRSELSYPGDDEVIITGFDTSTPGTKTMTITVRGLDRASINFVYAVVESMDDLLYGGGNGTEDSPYLINTVQHFSNIRFNLGAHYKLMDDLEIDIETWTPIGEINPEFGISGNWTVNPLRGFYGFLDGNEKTISMFNTGDSVSAAEGFQGLFIDLGRAYETVTIKNVTLEYSINTPAQRFIGLAKQTASGDGVHTSVVNLVNITTIGELNIGEGTPMIGRVWNGVVNVDRFVNEADMQVAGGFNSFLFVRGGAGLHNITNSSNSGNIVQRYEAVGSAFDETFYSGVFVARSFNFTAAYLFSKVDNFGHIVGNKNGSYHFVGYTYDDSPDSIIEVIDRHSNLDESYWWNKRDQVHEFIGYYDHQQDVNTTNTNRPMWNAIAIVLNNVETQENGTVACTVLRTSNEEYFSDGEGNHVDVTDCDSSDPEEDLVYGDLTYVIVNHEFIRITGQTRSSANANLVIPDDIDGKPVREIANAAFRHNRKLASVTISDNIHTIGNHAFDNAIYLGSVIFGEDSELETIKAHAFNRADSLTSIVLPNGVKRIEGSAFQRVYSLTKIIIPDSVTEVLTDAFLEANKLTIYVEVEESSKPAGWQNNWNSNRPVVWGYNPGD